MLQLDGKILKSPVHQKRLRRFLEGANRPSEEITVDDFLNMPTDLIPQNEHTILSREVGQMDLIDTDSQRLGTETVGNTERVDEVNGALDEPIIIDRRPIIKNSAHSDMNEETIGGGVLTRKNKCLMGMERRALRCGGAFN